jgi:hypothetical protein
VQNNLDEYHHHINKNVSSDNPGPKTSYGPRAVKAYDSDAGHNLNRLFGPKVNFFPSSYLIYYLSKDVFFPLERQFSRCFCHVMMKVKVSKNCANFGQTRTAGGTSHQLSIVSALEGACMHVP